MNCQLLLLILSLVVLLNICCIALKATWCVVLLRLYENIYKPCKYYYLSIFKKQQNNSQGPVYIMRPRHLFWHFHHCFCKIKKKKIPLGTWTDFVFGIKLWTDAGLWQTQTTGAKLWSGSFIVLVSLVKTWDWTISGQSPWPHLKDGAKSVTRKS